MLQAPTQAFLAETEGGEITENHKIRELFIFFIFLKVARIFYQSFLLDLFVNELSISLSLHLGVICTYTRTCFV